MIERWRFGYDVVYGVRARRKEGPVKRAAYALFYRIYSRLADIEVAVDSGDFFRRRFMTSTTRRRAGKNRRCRQPPRCPPAGCRSVEQCIGRAFDWAFLATGAHAVDDVIAESPALDHGDKTSGGSCRSASITTTASPAA